MTLPEGYRLISFDEIGSTNDIVKDLARKGEPAGAIVTAKCQTQGRGRHGNTWVSDTGNLFMTVLLRPQVTATRAAELSFVIAVALAECLAGFLPAGADVRLKWPNDILVGGKKISGILLESDIRPGGAVDWVAAGIGVNVSNAPDIGTSLAGTGLTVETVLETLVVSIDKWMKTWAGEGFETIRAQWLKYVYGLGQEMTVRLPSASKKGVFEGLTATGALKLKLANGACEEITAGEVHWGT